MPAISTVSLFRFLGLGILKPMKDLQRILKRIRQLQEKPYVLATVVQVEGSAYRGLGTRLLVESLQQSLGSISGGCLEGDLRQQAAQLLQEQGQTRLLRYDYSAQDDFIWGTGMGCSGIIQVLLERMSVGAHLPDLLYHCAFAGQRAALATVFASEGEVAVQLGQHLAFDGADFVLDQIADASLRAEMGRDVERLFSVPIRVGQPQAETRHYALPKGRVSVLLETLEPPVELVIFGAGYDAEPVVHMAAALGWRVTLVDHRVPYARPERFPEAEKVLLAPSGQWPGNLTLAAGTVALVMSHNYLQDQAMLRHLLPQPLAYLGVLGPRARGCRLLDELRAEGFSPRDPQRCFAPVGLDIGAETPEAIALAIVAEIQQVLSERPGGNLRDGTGPIHETA